LGPWGLHRIPSLVVLKTLDLLGYHCSLVHNQCWDLRLLGAFSLWTSWLAVAQRKRVMIILNPLP